MSKQATTPVTEVAIVRNDAIARVQIDYVQFNRPFSAGHVFFEDFKHGRSEQVKECWLIGDLFVMVTNQNDEEVIVAAAAAVGWKPLHNVSWLKGEHLMSPDDQVSLSKARQKVKAA